MSTSRNLVTCVVAGFLYLPALLQVRKRHLSSTHGHFTAPTPPSQAQGCDTVLYAQSERAYLDRRFAKKRGWGSSTPGMDWWDSGGGYLYLVLSLDRQLQLFHNHQNFINHIIKGCQLWKVTLRHVGWGWNNWVNWIITITIHRHIIFHNFHKVYHVLLNKHQQITF